MPEDNGDSELHSNSMSPEGADKIIEKTIVQYEKYVNPGMARLMRMLGTTIEKKTSGVYMYDIKGQKYLDFLSGHGAYNVGYCHPEVVQAVKNQVDLVAQSSSGMIMNKPKADLSERLAQITPGELTFSFICNSGTEANEGAIKLARISTGKPGIIAMENGFHGKSMGSLSATGRDQYKTPFEPLLPAFTHVPFGDIDAIQEAVNDDTAAVILEPIQGEGGVICPPEGYLANVRQLCNDKGILMILDEVQTAFGRTGAMFAVEHDGIAPDIMALAKALGGGVMPIGAFIATPKAFAPYEEYPLLHTSTFGGNPLSCAAANATIDLIIRENLSVKAAEKGLYIIKKLEVIKDRYPDIINDVRGKGLLIGIEFADEAIVGNMIYELELANVLVLYMINNPRVIRLEPPLIISYEQIDHMLGVLQSAAEKTKAVL